MSTCRGQAGTRVSQLRFSSVSGHGCRGASAGPGKCARRGGWHSAFLPGPQSLARRRSHMVSPTPCVLLVHMSPSDKGARQSGFGPPCSPHFNQISVKAELPNKAALTGLGPGPQQGFFWAPFRLYSASASFAHSFTIRRLSAPCGQAAYLFRSLLCTPHLEPSLAHSRCPGETRGRLVPVSLC